jgi:hypothetical protein
MFEDCLGPIWRTPGASGLMGVIVLEEAGAGLGGGEGFVDEDPEDVVGGVGEELAAVVGGGGVYGDFDTLTVEGPTDEEVGHVG